MLKVRCAQAIAIAAIFAIGVAVWTPAVFAANVCPTACAPCDLCIKYKSKPGCVCCKDCELKCAAPVQICMEVKDPSCCTNVLPVPICVPACCVGEAPCVSSEVGLLAGNVWYEWPCGYKVKVAIGKKKNNVLVTTFGL